MGKELTGFVEGGRGEWLHPQYGPFPDFCGIFVSDAEEVFIVGIWIDDCFGLPSYIAFVEFVEQVDNNNNVIKPDVYHFGFVQTYRWKQIGSSLVCAISRRTEAVINTQRSLERIAEQSAKLYTSFVG